MSKGSTLLVTNDGRPGRLPPPHGWEVHEGRSFNRHLSFSFLVNTKRRRFQLTIIVLKGGLIITILYETVPDKDGVFCV